MLNKTIFFLITFIIFFAPFAFGAVHIWSETILNIAVLALLYLSLIGIVRSGRIEYEKTMLNIFFLALIVVTSSQLFLNTTKDVYQTYASLKVISLNFALFLAITNAVKTKRDLDGLIARIAAAGFLMSVLGVLQSVTKADKIYWLWPFPRADFFGPFINANYFACYISLVIFATLGNILASISENATISWSLSLRQMAGLILDNLFNRKVVFNLFALTVMVSALFLSKSRGGIILFLSSLVFFASSIMLTRYFKKGVWFLASGIILSYLLLCWLGLDRTIAEVATIFSPSSFGGRADVYMDAVKMFKNYPLMGIGAGAFSTLFPVYSSGSVSNVYKYLHSDTLQFLVEVGIVGYSILVLISIAFLIQMILMIKNTSVRYKYYVGVGMLAAFFYLALHASIDFGLHARAISSLSVMLAAISAMLIGFHPSSRGRLEAETNRRLLFAVRGKAQAAVLYAIFTAAFFLLSFQVSRPLIAYMMIDNAPGPESFENALRLDPRNDDLYFREYLYFLDEYNMGRLTENLCYERAGEAIDRAMALNRYKTLYVAAKGDLELIHRNYDEARRLFNEASLREPYNPLIQMSNAYALFWSAINEKDPGRKGEMIRKGFVYYSLADSLSGGTVSLESIVKDEPSYLLLKALLAKENIRVR